MGTMMIHQFWRLSEPGPGNLGLAFTDDSLLLGQTPLIERRDGRFVVREPNEIDRLLKRAYRGEPAVDRLMPGLATVASALNANDPCLARIAAVHLKIPDLPSSAARDALEEEDSLIKYARDEGGGTDWNPALHPRAGTPPNPGWFAPTDGETDDTSRVRIAENKDDSRRNDAAPTADDKWVKIPPGRYIDELADFVQWIANAKPEDAKTIRAEIKRYYYDVGDANSGDALNAALSGVLQPGTTKEDRQATLNLIAHYARYDPAETGHLRDLLSGTTLLLLPWLASRAFSKPRDGTVDSSAGAAAARTELSQAEADAAAWKRGWAERGRYFEDRLGRELHPNFPIIDKIPNGVATSIKSLDLRAATYQDEARLTYRLRKYVSDLSEFDGARWANDVVLPSEIRGRALSLAIPNGSMTAAQREAIEAVRAWARMKNHNPVEFSIIEF
jgi:hypothetical protein